MNNSVQVRGLNVVSQLSLNLIVKLFKVEMLRSLAQGWNDSVNHPTAGEYQAIGLDLQGASPQYAAQLQQRMNDTKTKLDSNDEQQLNTLTKQDLVGDLLEATIFSYFAMNDVQDDIGARQANIVSYRAPSYGKFTTTLTTSYFFGQPRNVTATGLMMDVDRLSWSLADKGNDRENEIRYVQIIGSRGSAMEHLVPEKMFSTTENPAQGISAVKAMQLAIADGQKIWTITKDNLSVALQNIQLQPDTEREIANAVSAGKIVTAHEKTLNFNGWVGEGYIILDPDTGAGAYKIAGGSNGSYFDYINDISGYLVAALGFAAVMATFGAGFPVVLMLAVTAVGVTALMAMASDLRLLEAGCSGNVRLLNLIFTILSTTLGLLLSETGSVILATIAGWIYTSLVPAIAPVCKYLYK